MILDRNKLVELSSYLQNLGLIAAQDFVLSAEKPGEGNMNYTLRAKVRGGKSFIVKQARDYVEKYPSIPAPVERVLVEGAFYEAVKAEQGLSSFMPKLIHLDAHNHIIILEDLGLSSDLTDLYQEGAQLDETDAINLASYLSDLHKKFNAINTNELLANRPLRALNHEHIFVYPFMVDNGFDLDQIQPGLQALALLYKNDEQLKQKATALGRIYLQDGNALLHGDYYPGSWLTTWQGVKVIDPEFSFYGCPEFDLGVMLAHLMLARQSPQLIEIVKEHYQAEKSFNWDLLQAFVGIEIMRRIIGLAQLPLSLSLVDKELLLQKSYKMLMN